MNIRLIAFDLDGTLLNSSKVISPHTRSVLERAAAKGAILVPATGRLQNNVPEEVLSLPSVRYVIAINGAAVYDLDEKKFLYRAELGKEESLQFFRHAEKLPAIYGWYQNGQGWMPRTCYERIADYSYAPWLEENMKKVYLPIDSCEETLMEQEGGPQKLQLYFRDLEARKTALEEILQLYPQYAVSSSLENNIEINAPRATKGEALAFLASHLGLKTEETLAFGDGTNDITMIRQAGTGVAMGNAAPEMLAAADRVTASNDEDGLAKILEELGF